MAQGDLCACGGEIGLHCMNISCAWLKCSFCQTIFDPVSRRSAPDDFTGPADLQPS